jgi:hypothetical protein
MHLALLPDKQNRVRKRVEYAAAAPSLFMNEEAAIRIERDRELKRRIGGGAKICGGIHRKPFPCLFCRLLRRGRDPGSTPMTDISAV